MSKGTMNLKREKEVWRKKEERKGKVKRKK